MDAMYNLFILLLENTYCTATKDLNLPLLVMILLEENGYNI